MKKLKAKINLPIHLMAWVEGERRMRIWNLIYQKSKEE